MNEYRFTVEEEFIGERLDKYLSVKIEDITRSYIKKLIEEGKAFVNGKQGKSGTVLKNGDVVSFTVPAPVSLEITAEDIPLNIVYEDSELLVVNKPQGMVVHPAGGHYENTLVNALMAHCKDSLSSINGVIRPGIVHRIDKDTSGLLLVAKTNNAHLSLAKQLKEHTIHRVYIALVHGSFKDDEGAVDAPLNRHPQNRKKRCVDFGEGSKRAVTHYTVLQRFNGYTLVKCRLETGRTHQIRVHMAYIHHPLVGDEVYGIKKQPFKLNGQMLHALEIGFNHPKTGEFMAFSSEYPTRFTDIIKKLSPL